MSIEGLRQSHNGLLLIDENKSKTKETEDSGSLNQTNFISSQCIKDIITNFSRWLANKNVCVCIYLCVWMMLLLLVTC